MTREEVLNEMKNDIDTMAVMGSLPAPNSIANIYGALLDSAVLLKAQLMAGVEEVKGPLDHAG